MCVALHYLVIGGVPSADVVMSDAATTQSDKKETESLVMSTGDDKSQKSMAEAEPGTKSDAAPQLSKKDIDSTDGIPQAVQGVFKVEGEPQGRKEYVELKVSYPSSVLPEKLKGLIQTMTDNGVSEVISF